MKQPSHCIIVGRVFQEEAWTTLKPKKFEISTFFINNKWKNSITKCFDSIIFKKEEKVHPHKDPSMNKKDNGWMLLLSQKKNYYIMQN